MTRRTIELIRQTWLTTMAALLGGVIWPRLALAQAPPAPTAAEEGSRGAWLVLLVVALLIAIVTVVAIAVSARRRHMDAALLLQSRVSDALLRDATVGRYPIVATADIPLWPPWADAVLTLKGTVDRSNIREAARALVQGEIESAGGQAALVDRLVVDSRALAHAA